jgi:hypothetical protein
VVDASDFDESDTASVGGTMKTYTASDEDTDLFTVND